MSDSNLGFLTKIPSFADLKDGPTNDVTKIWNKANLPIFRKQRIEAKVKCLITQFETARKRAKRRILNEVKSGFKICWILVSASVSLIDFQQYATKNYSCLCHFEESRKKK